MRDAVIAYFVALLVMAGLDFVWLSLTAVPIYHRALGAVMTETVNIPAAIAFYVIYVLGVVIFAIKPAIESGDWRIALVRGALFGFFAYATYDLTNLATLKVWSFKVSLIDITWGAIVTGTAASVSAVAALALEK
jgi:uncharacterized membrane protein